MNPVQNGQPCTTQLIVESHSLTKEGCPFCTGKVVPIAKLGCVASR